MTDPDLCLEALPEPLPGDPMVVLAGWLDHATELALTPNPNAFTLATVDTRVTPPEPDARVLLCKALEPEPGTVVFFTNYHSTKGRQLEHLPWATAVFHWDKLELQARVRGPVTRISAEQSDEYFASRPLLSRLGAWASKQSQPVASRAALMGQLQDAQARFGIEDPLDPAEDGSIPRPAYWGGYRLWAREVELWIGQRGRLHERGRWQRDVRVEEDGGYSAGPWENRRLQP